MSELWASHDSLLNWSPGRDFSTFLKGKCSKYKLKSIIRGSRHIPLDPPKGEQNHIPLDPLTFLRCFVHAITIKTNRYQWIVSLKATPQDPPKREKIHSKMTSISILSNTKHPWYLNKYTIKTNWNDIQKHTNFYRKSWCAKIPQFYNLFFRTYERPLSFIVFFLKMRFPAGIRRSRQYIITYSNIYDKL